MSIKTLIKKVTLCDTPGAEGATDLLGLIQDTDLDGSLIVDGKVRVSPDDSAPGFIEGKIVTGDDIQKTVIGGGGNETLKLYTYGKARVSNTDTTFDYLDNKLEAGSHLTKTIISGGSDENIEFDVKLSSFMGNHQGWISEIIGNALPRTDESEFDAASYRLLGDSGTYKNIIHRENTGGAQGPMGILANIGSALAMDADDWELIHGILFEYTCSANNWFDIKNEGTAPGGDFKPIYTGTAEDIRFVKRALFCYDKDEEMWFLISWTRAVWERIEQFGTLPANTDVDVALNLPQAGLYHFDVYCGAEERRDGNIVATEAPQSLSIKSTAATIIADTSGFFTLAVNGTPPSWSNLSLQGSGIIPVLDADVSARKIQLNALLPNGQVQAVTGGYIHLMYFGEMIDA